MVVSGVFEGLIDIAYLQKAVLKFRGDALLLLFSGEARDLRPWRQRDRVE